MIRGKGAVAGLLLGAAAGVALRRRRQAQAILPELRTPMVYAPLFVSNRLALTIGRKFLGGATEACAEVGLTTPTAPRPARDGAVEMFIYDPPGRPRPSGALLWIHGGGLIMGRPESDHALCSRIAQELGILVVSVRYRLAPEHPFPAGLDDCATALDWLYDHTHDLGLDPERLAVGGASAGGGLAAALCQRAHDEGRVPVAFQLLVYPMLDDRTTLRRQCDIRSVFGWTPASNRYAWTSYLGRRHPDEPPPAYAVPSRRDGLTGLPPAWLGVGDLDLFHDEVVVYARRLQANGVHCELALVPGMYHAADVGLSDSAPSMQAFRDGMIEALGRAVALGAGRPAPPLQCPTERFK